MDPQEQPSTPVSEVPAARTNWAGNYTFTAREVVTPASVDALQALLPQLSLVKAYGTRHSFNPIADSEGTQIDLSAFQSIELDAEARQVTVGAGVTYGQLAPWLEKRGFALHNLASLPHISIAGACATGTHGSGLHNGCLTTAVAALEWIDAKGQRQRMVRGNDVFNLACVHLGALGVVTSLTLDVQPTYQVAQTVYENLSFDHLQHSLREIFGAAYSVSLFTDWQGHRATQAWVKQRLDGPLTPETPETFYGATRQTAKLHPLPELSAENCTEQEGVPGPWHERLPHFRLDYTPSAGAELQTEYFVPLEQGYEAILAVEALRDQITPLLFISELRTIAADRLALSMACERTSLAIHFTWKPELAAVQALLPRIEEVLAPFAARPHWAKLFTTPAPRLAELYPQRESFLAVARQCDPRGHFRNVYLTQCFG